MSVRTYAGVVYVLWIRRGVDDGAAEPEATYCHRHDAERVAERRLLMAKAGMGDVREAYVTEHLVIAPGCD